MTAPVALLIYALVVSLAGIRLLPQADWPQRSPRLGILAWQGLTASVVVAVLLAGLALALPTMPITGDLADLLHACAIALREHYATPGGAVVASAGALLAAAVTGRATYAFAHYWSTARRHRTTQRRGLDMVAHRHMGSGVLVDHPTPAAYCIPGRRREVVFTSAAMAALDGRQMDAVLAHEQAHLRSRHDLVLAAAGALQAAFPFIPVFGVALAELARLIEMHADDKALGGRDRRVLATALVRLADSASPIGSLGAGGESALARVRRLVQPARPLGMVGSVAAVAATLTMVAIPLVIAVAPAFAAAAMDYCPVGFPT